jgi:hypothetical protein
METVFALTRPPRDLSAEVYLWRRLPGVPDMIVRKGFAPLLCDVSQLIADGERAATVERFSIVANGGTVGHLASVQNGRNIEIDCAISDNGRGPKHKEPLLFDAAGIPLELLDTMGGEIP